MKDPRVTGGKPCLTRLVETGFGCLLCFALLCFHPHSHPHFAKARAKATRRHQRGDAGNNPQSHNHAPHLLIGMSSARMRRRRMVHPRRRIPSISSSSQTQPGQFFNPF